MFDKKRNKWMSRITIKSKGIFLGYFDDDKKASDVYQKKLIEIKNEKIKY